MVITNTGNSCIGYNHLPFLSGTTVTQWHKAFDIQWLQKEPQLRTWSSWRPNFWNDPHLVLILHKGLISQRSWEKGENIQIENNSEGIKKSKNSVNNYLKKARIERKGNEWINDGVWVRQTKGARINEGNEGAWRWNCVPLLFID